jgi:hypothetical protein
MLAVSGGAAVGQAAVQGIAAHLVSPQAFLAVATLLLAGLMPSPPEVSLPFIDHACLATVISNGAVSYIIAYALHVSKYQHM